MPWCCFEVQTIISVPCLSDCSGYQGMEEILHGGDIHPTHSRLSQVPRGLSQAMDQGKIGMQSTGSKQSQPHRSSPQDTPSPAHHEVTVGLSLLQEAPQAGPALLHHHSTPAVGLPKTPYSISGVANPAWVLSTSPCVIHVSLATPHLRQFTPHHQLLIFHGSSQHRDATVAASQTRADHPDTLLAKSLLVSPALQDIFFGMGFPPAPSPCPEFLVDAMGKL